MKVFSKTVFRVCATLLVTLFLFSCSQDGRKDIVQDKSQTTLNFHFKTGAGDPVHYTRATIQDTDEASLQTLQYFQFSDDGNTLIESEYIGDVNAAVIGSNSTTSVVIKNGNDYVYARHFDSNAVGSYMFYFVANHPEITRAEASSVATLKAFVLSGKLKADGSSTPMDLMLPHLDGQDATSSANRYRMPMAGVAERGGSQSISPLGTGEVIVPMLRTVARIDVYNHVPGFEITSMKLKNTYDRATLFPSEQPAGTVTNEAPSGAARYEVKSFCYLGYGKPSVADMKPYSQWLLPIKGSSNNDPTSIVKKAFYLYEGKQSSVNSEGLTLVVTGLLSGAAGASKAVTVEVPFKKTEPSGTSSLIHIKRNTLYEVHFNSSEAPQSQGVEFSIKCKEWQSEKPEESSELNVLTAWLSYMGTTHYVNFTAPRVTVDLYFDGGSDTEIIKESPSPYANYRYFYYNPRQGLAVANYRQRKFYFIVDSDFRRAATNKVILNEDPEHIKILPGNWPRHTDPKNYPFGPQAQKFAIEVNYPDGERMKKAKVQMEFTFLGDTNEKQIFTFVSDPSFVNTETTENL